MKIVCAWCEAIINEGEDIKQSVSHGMCKHCLFELVGAGGTNIYDFLNSLDISIMIFDQRTCLQYANTRAQKDLDQPTHEIIQSLCGDIFVCENSFKSERCGNTDKCGTCDLRNALISTYQTGMPVYELPITIQAKLIDRTERREYKVTTAKIKDLVILKFIKQ